MRASSAAAACAARVCVTQLPPRVQWYTAYKRSIHHNTRAVFLTALLCARMHRRAVTQLRERKFRGLMEMNLKRLGGRIIIARAYRRYRLRIARATLRRTLLALLRIRRGWRRYRVRCFVAAILA